jgi:hypothetical protein
MKLEKDDAIVVTCGDRTVPAKVEMISSNQVSILISFDALLGGHSGIMPATRWDMARNAYRSIIDGTEIIVKKLQPRGTTSG